MLLSISSPTKSGWQAGFADGAKLQLAVCLRSFQLLLVLGKRQCCKAVCIDNLLPFHDQRRSVQVRVRNLQLQDGSCLLAGLKAYRMLKAVINNDALAFAPRQRPIANLQRYQAWVPEPAMNFQSLVVCSGVLHDVGAG